MGSSAEGVRVDCARWLLPVASPPVADGALATRGGRVLAAGRRREVRGQFPGAAVHEHPDAAILPGLVNCHAHLELTPLRGRVRAEGKNFADWLAALIEAKAALNVNALREGVREGLAESRRWGTALVADTVSPQVAHQVAQAGLYPAGRALALVELLGFARSHAEGRWAQAQEALEALGAGGVQAALAPHSPYTVSAALLKRCAASGSLLSVHLAESRDEVEFFSRLGDSALRDLLVSRGAWEEGWSPPGVSPAAYLDALGLLGPRTLAVHLVQTSAEDLALLARRGVRVCLCPRSNAATGVGAAPLAAMLKAGLRVALGTDSLASNDDLNLFREALAAVDLGAAPEEALRMATLSGAEVLGRADMGALAPGCTPQPLLVPVEGREPVRAALESGARGEARWLFEEED